jgi:hypothetical protein
MSRSTRARPRRAPPIASSPTIVATMSSSPRVRCLRTGRPGRARGRLTGARRRAAIRRRLPSGTAGGRPSGLVPGPLKTAAVSARHRRMCGSPVTSGLSANRGSAAASGTSKISLPKMACAQNDTLRCVSCVPLKPQFDLDHCRFSSTSVASAMGTSHMLAASPVIASKIASGADSRMSYDCSAARAAARLRSLVVGPIALITVVRCAGSAASICAAQRKQRREGFVCRRNRLPSSYAPRNAELSSMRSPRRACSLSISSAAGEGASPRAGCRGHTDRDADVGASQSGRRQPQRRHGIPRSPRGARRVA